MRASFRELLERAEVHVRDHVGDPDERDRLLGDISAFRRAPDFPEEHEALHAFEKFLHFACKYVARDANLRAMLAPYVAAAHRARERVGGCALPGVGWDSPADQ